MPQKNHIALLLFSRSSEEESVAKNIFPHKGSANNKKLAHSLISRSIKVCKQSGLPFYFWDESKQVGDTFGQKLANAIEATFNKGYQKVIVIGNDCPHLKHQHIFKAINALQKNDVVLAPTKKGGTYLIGLSQKLFNKNEFAHVSWQKTTTYDNLISLFSPFNLTQFPLLDDVNSFADLQKQINYLSNNDFLRCLAQSMFASLKNFIKHIQHPPSGYILRNLFSLKAPPIPSLAF